MNVLLLPRYCVVQVMQFTVVTTKRNEIEVKVPDEATVSDLKDAISRITKDPPKAFRLRAGVTVLKVALLCKDIESDVKITMDKQTVVDPVAQARYRIASGAAGSSRVLKGFYS